MAINSRRMGVGVAAGVLLVAGCGNAADDDVSDVAPGASHAAPDDDVPDAAPDGSHAALTGLTPDDYDGRFRTVATVLENRDHGPQLCYAVDESLPPQCGGVDVVGWHWSDVQAESAAGTTWGYYSLVGTFDGTAFTLTEPARPGRDRGGSSGGGSSGGGGSGPATPCPTPKGGWTPVEPDLATDSALDAAIRLARSSEGFGGLWVDQRIPAGRLSEANANDPTGLVLNATTTGDPGQMQSSLREVWGGSLCVSPARRSMSDLRPIQRDVVALPGILSTGIDEVRGRVEVNLLVATEQLQRDLDEEYGEGAIRLHGALEPIDHD